MARFIQGNSGVVFAGVQDGTITLNSPTTAGNTVVIGWVGSTASMSLGPVQLAAQDGTNIPSTPTSPYAGSTNGNSYTTSIALNCPAGWRTFSLSGNPISNSGAPWVVAEFSGVSAYEQDVTASSIAGGISVINTPTALTVNSNDLVLVLVADSTGLAAPTSPFALVAPLPLSTIGMEWQVKASPGTVNPNWTMSSAGTWDAQLTVLTTGATSSQERSLGRNIIRIQRPGWRWM